MSYHVELSSDFKEHFSQYVRSGNKVSVKKIQTFIEELQEHPRTGTGQPERLRHYQLEVWSRRIDKKNRLVYQIIEEQLIVHYFSLLEVLFDPLSKSYGRETLTFRFLQLFE